ncbi:transglutaminase family protein [Vagococcus fluvialis]|uniref:transglutaminase-like domain-containing protein n=1 Tax=Vagococcus fluvialis TaxID=2738 RepID=UPI001A8ED02A|nr:transglutaminase family protein [Vagococcus fluvialis]MBO0428629.1 transglutaminase family protein [Vagococcus fluvialis]
MRAYLEETKLLNFSDEKIQELINEKNWLALNDYNKISEIYKFVRDDILFGYNKKDELQASDVLSDGYGQCNTKGILLMALFRSVGLPCRLHGFTINKELQKGAMTGIIYRLAPENVVHSWVEVYFEGNWYNLEGFIIDQGYLSELQNKFSPTKTGSFCGYGVATDNFLNPKIEWQKNDTYIQKEGINQDFGVFNSPDDFFSTYSQHLSPFKKFIYEMLARKWMNKNVKKIRSNGK